jgi:hypothetical protein
MDDQRGSQRKGSCQVKRLLTGKIERGLIILIPTRKDLRNRVSSQEVDIMIEMNTKQSPCILHC